jgi:hypothetical protein
VLAPKFIPCEISISQSPKNAFGIGGLLSQQASPVHKTRL